MTGAATRPADALPLVPVAGGVRLAVRLTPKASRNAVRGVAQDADGTPVLKVAVTAVPENGKANQALIKVLAKTWKLPKTAVTIIAGAADRRKTLFIAGEPATLTEDLGERIRGHV